MGAASFRMMREQQAKKEKAVQDGEEKPTQSQAPKAETQKRKPRSKKVEQ